jgi:hypothetical protein
MDSMFKKMLIFEGTIYKWQTKFSYLRFRSVGFYVRRIHPFTKILSFRIPYYNHRWNAFLYILNVNVRLRQHWL